MFIPVLTLIFQRSGLTLQQVFIIHASFSLIRLVCEVPSGYLSDSWGRKQTLTLGCLLKIIGVLCYCLGTGFEAFMLAVLFLGMGSTMLSGTLEATTFDTLLELNESKKYRKLAGKQWFIQFGTEALSALIGGWLVLSYLKAPFWGTLIVFLIGPAISLSIKEPRVHHFEQHSHWERMRHICGTVVLKNVTLRSLVTLYGMMVAFALIGFWLGQAYLEHINLPLAWFGPVHALIVASHAVAAYYAYRLTKWYDDRLLLCLVALGLTSVLIALSFITAWWGIIFLVALRMLWGIAVPVLQDMINHLVKSQMRATVLSMGSFVNNVLFSVMSPFFGYVADWYSLSQAFWLAGFAAGISMAVVLWAMRGEWSKVPR